MPIPNTVQEFKILIDPIFLWQNRRLGSNKIKTLPSTIFYDLVALEEL